MSGQAPRAVLFDLDDTLVHRARSIAAWAARFARDFADRLPDADVDEIAELSLAQDNGGYLGAGSPHESIRAAVGATLASRLHWAGRVDAREIEDHWRAQLPAHSVEMPGASAAVDALAQRGLRLAIVSNGAERSRAATLANLAFRDRIGTLVSSERAGARKPEAAVFTLAASELGVAPHDCWVVGDHPINDVAGGEAAGMKAVWLTGFHRWDRTAPPLRAIDSLAQLAALVDAAR